MTKTAWCHSIRSTFYTYKSGQCAIYVATKESMSSIYFYQSCKKRMRSAPSRRASHRCRARRACVAFASRLSPFQHRDSVLFIPTPGVAYFIPSSSPTSLLTPMLFLVPEFSVYYEPRRLVLSIWFDDNWISRHKLYTTMNPRYMIIR